MDKVSGDEKTDEIVSHYTEAYDESKRLADGFGQFERARTQELIARYLGEPPSVVLDVGGASGPYSFFVSGRGHEVHLVDIVPKHVEQARAKSREAGMPALAGMRVGDARALDFPDEYADALINRVLKETCGE